MLYDLILVQRGRAQRPSIHIQRFGAIKK